VALARRLEVVTRSTDTLCRFGATSSSTWRGAGVPTQAEEVAERLLGVVAKPFSLAGTEVQQHASVGAVVLEGTGKAWPTSSGMLTPPCMRPSARARATTSSSPPPCTTKRSTGPSFSETLGTLFRLVSLDAVPAHRRSHHARGGRLRGADALAAPRAGTGAPKCSSRLQSRAISSWSSAPLR